jgi:hypothetical protein
VSSARSRFSRSRCCSSPGISGPRRRGRIRSQRGNVLLIFKYSSIYGIAAIGAAIVIIAGGIDLAPGAVIALTTVVAGYSSSRRLAAWAAPAGGCSSASSPGLAVVVADRARRPAAVHRHARRDGHLARHAFIFTEARFYDLSAKLPRDWH